MSFSASKSFDTFKLSCYRIVEKGLGAANDNTINNAKANNTKKGSDCIHFIDGSMNHFYYKINIPV